MRRKPIWKSCTIHTARSRTRTLYLGNRSGQCALHEYASYGQSGRQERIERGRNETVADSSANIRMLR